MGKGHSSSDFLAFPVSLRKPGSLSTSISGSLHRWGGSGEEIVSSGSLFWEDEVIYLVCGVFQNEVLR